MTWTKKKPTKEGWYWWEPFGADARVVQIIRFGGLRITANGFPIEDLKKHGRWASIPFPKEPKTN